MYDTLNKQALAFGKQFTDNVIKAQGVALKNFEQISSVQAKALEEQATAHADFANEATKANDFDSVRELWTKSSDFARNSAEKLYATQQDVLAIMAKNAQVMTDLGREQFEAGSEVLAAAPKAAKKASK
ncbi:MAG: phasin family protein [Xanthomonadales bacterium]|nr:phasin family protein [Xanthomonadales bacterium]